MIKIGIIGNPGSGKTTFSRYLENKYPSIGYLSVDKVTTSNEELHTTRNQILWSAYNNSLSSEKLKEIQLNFRSKLSASVDEKLKQIEDSGKKIVIIDYSVLYTLPTLWDSVQYKILLTRDDRKRKEGLIRREGKKYIGPLDTFVKSTCLKDDSIDTDFIIENNGSLKDLYNRANAVLDEIQSRNNAIAPIRHYSYYIVKPDGVRHFKEIYSSLERMFEGMESVRFFKIDNYGEIIQKLYYKLFEKYPETFPEAFNSFKTGISSLYGNEGILIIMSELHQSEKEYEDFRKKVLKTKLAIREKIMDPNVRMLERISNPSNLHGDSILHLEGNKYRIDIPKSLSRIHCPEDNIEDTENELKILLESGIISNANMLGLVDIKNVIKYGSIMGFSQDSAEQRPDIAKFEHNKIADSLCRE